jgi:hypothetical protein
MRRFERQHRLKIQSLAVSVYAFVAANANGAAWSKRSTTSGVSDSNS